MPSKRSFAPHKTTHINAHQSDPANALLTKVLAYRSAYGRLAHLPPLVRCEHGSQRWKSSKGACIQAKSIGLLLASDFAFVYASWRSGR